MKKNLQILVAILALTLMACNGQKNETTSVDDEMASSVEDAVNTMSSLLDDQADEAYASNMQKTYPELIQELFIPKAYAESCMRAVSMPCESGMKQATFDGCTIFRGFVTMEGGVDLDYSQNDCSMDSDGDSVVRTYRYSFNGPRGGTRVVSSADHVNYNEVSLGGGAQLTKVSGGWELDVMGKNVVFTRGDVVRNRSIRTLSPLQIEGGLRRSLRRVTNGSLEIAHNASRFGQFTVTYTANNLEYSSSCCHPVSGSLSVDSVGSINSSGTVTFNSCGSAELELNGEIENVEFTFCE